jgi:DNA-binding SARP family transcriptional activator/tetratricopeptide (TPR) repeat protein
MTNRSPSGSKKVVPKKVGPALELALLGSPELRWRGQPLNLPTRKAVALLVYLACEPGVHPREKLASLLWPDNDETGGRTALRKALGFLTAEFEVRGKMLFLNVNRDSLSFKSDPSVTHHFNDLELAAKRSRKLDDTDLEALRTSLEQTCDRVRGEFMAGFSLPDAFEFEDWLEVRREATRRDFDAVLQRLARVQAGAGHVPLALATARKRLDLDNLNEAAHRAVIELHLETDDRSGALEAYRACQTILERELGIGPAAPTQALAERARAGVPEILRSVVQPEVIAPKVRAPATPVQAAPFVGREREWQMLEDAWNAGLISFVSGEPGSGKSRLMREFLTAHGAFVTLENRPGDANVPYSSLARHLRMLFKAAPVMLPAWVNAELARILPELGEAPEISSEQGKLRFVQAVAAAFAQVLESFEDTVALLYDDAQFTDLSSSEVTSFALETLEPDTRERLRILYAYRPQELPVDLETRVNHTLGRGEGVLIELEPLGTNDLETLLFQLEAGSESGSESGSELGSEAHDLAQTLAKVTGGNPLFVLETLKSLREMTGQTLNAQNLEQMRTQGGLPRSLKVNQVISQRLERLSKSARDLVRVAAVMGQEFSLVRAAMVLETNALTLASASEELEAAGILRGNRFAHDLLFETTLAGIQRSSKQLLNARALSALYDDTGIVAATLVRFAVASEQPDLIFKYSREAGRDAYINLWALEDAIRDFERARQTLHTLPADADAIQLFGREEIFSLYKRLANIYQYTNRPDQEIQVLEELVALSNARSDAELEFNAILFLTSRAHANRKNGPERVRELVERLLELAKLLGRLDLLALAQGRIATVALNLEFDSSLDQMRFGLRHAEAALEYAATLHRTRQPSSFLRDLDFPGIGSQSGDHLLINNQNNVAVWLSFLGQFEEAEALRTQAVEYNQSLDTPTNPPYFLKELALLKLALGKIAEALPYIDQALEAARDWNLPSRVWVHIPRLHWLLETGAYDRTLQEIAELHQTAVPESRNNLLELEALAHLALGNLEMAQNLLKEAQATNTFDEDQFQMAREYLESELCAVHALQGDWDQAFTHAKRALEQRQWPLVLDPIFCTYWPLETEALARTDIALARASLETRAAMMPNLPRHRVSHLRAEAAFERIAGKLETAQNHLETALRLAQDMQLARENWEIQAELAQVLEQRKSKQAKEIRLQAVAARNLLSKAMDEGMRKRYLEFTDRQILRLS